MMKMRSCAVLRLLITIAFSTTFPNALRVVTPHEQQNIVAPLFSGDATVSVDLTSQHAISPTLFGIFFEEIGHAGEGGLYAELIQDRSFDATAAAAEFFSQHKAADGSMGLILERGTGNTAIPLPKRMPVNLETLSSSHMRGTDPVSYPPGSMQAQKGSRRPVKRSTNTTHGDQAIILPWIALAGTTTTLSREVPLNSGNDVAMEVTVGQPTDPKNGKSRGGLANVGYWGVYVEAGANYTFSIYVRNPEDREVELDVAVTSSDLRRRLGGVTLTVERKEGWARCEGTLTAEATETDARLVVSFEGPTTLILDSLSLFPSDNVKKARSEGHRNPWPFRPDLLQALKDLQPGFIRFPGGCYVEGDWMRNRFNWKHAIGRNEERPGHYNLWGYWSTDGLGLFEYMLLAEELRAEPVWVLNNGVAHGDSIPTGNMGSLLQDALDSLEFIMGPANSTWGAVRAAMGRSEPWHITYVAIGNEDCGKPYYNQNYALFYGALSTAYPHLRLIANCDLGAEGPTDIWDWHVYTNPDSMFGLRRAFDGRDPAAGHLVFASEYAVTDGGGWGNLIGAVAEAGFMTGLERNGAAVPLAAYAPLFVHWSDRPWPTNMIVIDNHRWFGIPSYHVQRLFRESQGVAYLATDVQMMGLSETVAASATCQETECEAIVIKLVNFSPTSQMVVVKVKLDAEAGTAVAQRAEGVMITSDHPGDENTFEEPNKVSPKALFLDGVSESFAVEMEPYSVNAVRLHIEVPPANGSKAGIAVS